MIENKINNKRYRADHIVKDLFPEINAEACSFSELETIIKEKVKKYENSETDW
ncbi:Uncharacterised protein, partial [Metamycoplasma alkalescens]